MIDLDTLQAHLVDLSNPFQSPIVSEFDSQLCDSLLASEYDELVSNGLTTFSTESGYDGVLFSPEKADEAKAKIIEMITVHAKKLIDDHDKTITRLRELHVTFKQV